MEAGDKKKITVGTAYQEATIHLKTAHARKKDTNIKQKNFTKCGE